MAIYKEQMVMRNLDYASIDEGDSVLIDAALADCTAVREGHVYQLPHAIEAVDSPVPGSFLGSG